MKGEMKMTGIQLLRKSSLTQLLVLICSLITIGCASTDEEYENKTASALGVSSNSLVVGETLEIYVKDLSSDNGTDFQLMFAGQFFADDGSVTDVRVTQRAILDGVLTRGAEDFQVLRLSRFGPFGNPFSETDRPGRFEGTVAVQQADETGQLATLRPPQPIELTVEASIIIDEFQPIKADCGAPALRAFAGLAY
jgi:hypothetical protein